jgi:Uma2 family endonuclease
MNVSIPIQAIELAPGSQIVIRNLSWQDFEGLVQDLGEKRKTRVVYSQGTIEIMARLVLYERPHRIIAYIITTILEIQGRNWEDFGLTTFKLPGIAGIQLDTCFYIENANKVKGATQMDLSIYPPPDLAIEFDVTSKTIFDACASLGIPELWTYNNHRLTVYILKANGYVESSFSTTFSNLDMTELIPRMLQKAIDNGTRQMLREIRTFLQEKS